MKNQRGFAVLSFLFFFSFIFFMAQSFLWTLWFLNQKHKLDKFCWETALKAQEELIRGNQKILAINPLAQALIAKKKVLEAQILLAPPPIKLKAILKRDHIIKKQRALKKRQQTLFYTSSLRAQRHLLEGRRIFQRQMTDLQGFWQAPLANQGWIVFSKAQSKLNIQQRDIAPTYTRGKNHSKRQEISVEWSIPLQRILPPWIRNSLQIHRSWRGQCFSHPQEKGYTKWFANIGKGRVLLKALSSLSAY